MKNEFDKLNEVDNDLYIEEIEVSEEEKESIRKRVMKKVNTPRRKNKKKMAMAASLCLIIGGSFALTNENVMAAVDRIGKSLESFFEIEEEDYKPYKKEILTEVEDKGIKFILNEAILDNDELFISLTVDYSKFNIEGLENNIKKEFSVVPSENYHSVSLNGEAIEINGYGGTNDFDTENKKVNILYSLDMENRKGLDAEYDIKLVTPKMLVQEHKIGGIREKIEGNWNMEFKIDGAELAKERKVIEVNKDATAIKDDKELKVTIEELVVTPISMGLKTSVNKELEEVLSYGEKNEMYSLGFDFYDQDGKKINFYGNGAGPTEDGYETYEKWMIDREVTRIEVVPKLTYYNKYGYHNTFKDIKFEDQAIEIDIK
ncbi:MAG: DUF4179 domain-containing protein [Sarcina sp.]